MSGSPCVDISRATPRPRQLLAAAIGTPEHGDDDYGDEAHDYGGGADARTLGAESSVGFTRLSREPPTTVTGSSATAASATFAPPPAPRAVVSRPYVQVRRRSFVRKKKYIHVHV